MEKGKLIAFRVPEELHARLTARVGGRGVSGFCRAALERALERQEVPPDIARAIDASVAGTVLHGLQPSPGPAVEGMRVYPPPRQYPPVPREIPPRAPEIPPRPPAPKAPPAWQVKQEKKAARASGECLVCKKRGCGPMCTCGCHARGNPRAG